MSELELHRLTTGQAQQELAKSHEQLELVRQKIVGERETLDQVHNEIASGQQDLQVLLEAINKRHHILESLDAQLDSEIVQRRRDIEVAVCGQLLTVSPHMLLLAFVA